MFDLKTANKSSFDEALNTVFQIKLENNNENPIELTLVNSSEKDSKDLYSFSLIFESDTDKFPIISDNTYKMFNEKLGDLIIFISPFQKKNEKIYYDAQFTRFKNE